MYMSEHAIYKQCITAYTQRLRCVYATYEQGMAAYTRPNNLIFDGLLYKNTIM